jgi:hypothetical protein
MNRTERCQAGSAADCRSGLILVFFWKQLSIVILSRTMRSVEFGRMHHSAPNLQSALPFGLATGAQSEVLRQFLLQESDAFRPRRSNIMSHTFGAIDGKFH